jgi:dipeptidyl aminopeptidase/acylaminoacyl peptidase
VAAWLIGHTDRFAAAVIERAIVDWTAGVLLSPDGPRRAANWMGAWPWDDSEQYVKHSPVYFAANFRTPTLVLSGDGDAQSEELYRALQVRNVKTAMARLGDGPADRVLALEAALGWFGW